MAVIPFTTNPLQGGLVIIQWTLAPGDTGLPIMILRASGAIGSIQAEGVFGGGEVYLEGSNDGVNFRPVIDVAHHDTCLAAPGIMEFSTSCAYLRPVLAGGTSSSVNISLVVR